MAAILVAYHTKTGTTKAYAEAIAEAMRKAGREAEAKNLAEAGGLSAYGAVILGAPVNGMRAVPELSAFIAANEGALRGKSCAVFVVSYMTGAAGAGWNKAIDKAASGAAASIGAKAWKVLPGKVDGPLPGLMRLMFGLPKGLPLDRRDIGAAEAWAAELAKALA